MFTFFYPNNDIRKVCLSIKTAKKILGELPQGTIQCTFIGKGIGPLVEVLDAYLCYPKYFPRNPIQIDVAINE